MNRTRLLSAPLGLLGASALAVSLLFGTSSSAAPLSTGGPDQTFGSGGKVVTDFSQTDDSAHAMLIQPDGKIVVAGQAHYGVFDHFAVARYNPNGSLDPDFSSDGLVDYHFSNESNDRARALALQSNGKIVVGGETQLSGEQNFALVRYNADGTPDTSFGGGAVNSPWRVNNNDTIDTLLIGPDERITAVGTGSNGAVGEIQVARYNTDGTPDTNFGTGGFLSIAFPNGANEVAVGAALVADGKLLIGGYDLFTCGAGCYNSDMVVIRLNNNGSFDASFDADGVVRIDFGGNSDQARAMLVQPDGKIVLAGSSGPTGTNPAKAMVRLTAAGELDSTFGGTGKIVYSESQLPIGITSMAALADGKILLAGNGPFNATTGLDFALSVMNADGTIDSNFGTGGIVTFDLGSQYNEGAEAVAVQSDGKGVAAGSVEVSGSTSDFAVVRVDGLQAPAATPTSAATSSPTNTATVVPTSTPVATATTVSGCLFSDVCPGDYWLEPVRELVALGAISGYSDNTFRPFNNTTRGQLAKIVVVAEGYSVQTPTTPTFSDVASDNPFYGYIETAAARGIVSGYSEGTFKPFNNVTRGQLAKIIVVAEGWQLAEPVSPTFSDVARSNPFFGQIETAYAHGIISGYDVAGGGKEFRWGNNATRAQIAKIVALAVSGSR